MQALSSFLSIKILYVVCGFSSLILFGRLELLVVSNSGPSYQAFSVICQVKVNAAFSAADNVGVISIRKIMAAFIFWVQC